MKFYNFGAGPSSIPREVLDKASKAILSYDEKTGLSILELSHRSKEYLNLVKQCKEKMTKILNIPSNYSILFMQGGGNGQFASVALNLLKKNKAKTADYIITGSWSKKAYEEALKLGCQVNIVCNSENESGEFITINEESSWKFSGKDAAYVYYCDNETVEGIEFHEIPKIHHEVPLVCDMSSNLLSKPIDVSKFGLIYAGAQKNLGAAGVTIVIVRKDLLNNENVNNSFTPSVLDYNIMDKHDSNYNTPPVFNVLVVDLMLDWIINNSTFQGSLQKIGDYNEKKANLLYNQINNSSSFYCPIDERYRSKMNIIFKLKNYSSEIENKFIKEAEAIRLLQLKGHRSVGGFRASLYNSVDLEAVEKLKDFILNFD